LLGDTKKDRQTLEKGGEKSTTKTRRSVSWKEALVRSALVLKKKCYQLHEEPESGAVKMLGKRHAHPKVKTREATAWQPRLQLFESGRGNGLSHRMTNTSLPQPKKESKKTVTDLSKKEVVTDASSSRTLKSGRSPWLDRLQLRNRGSIENLGEKKKGNTR